MSQIDNEKTKVQSFPIFKGFMHISWTDWLYFGQTSWIGLFQRVNKERVGCPVVSYEEIIAVSQWKMPQIVTKMTKWQKFPIFEVLMHFF